MPTQTHLQNGLGLPELTPKQLHGLLMQKVINDSDPALQEAYRFYMKINGFELEDKNCILSHNHSADKVGNNTIYSNTKKDGVLPFP